VHKIKEKRTERSKLNNPTYKDKQQQRKERRQQKRNGQKAKPLAPQTDNKAKLQKHIQKLEASRAAKAEGKATEKKQLSDVQGDYVGTAAKPGTSLKMRSKKKIVEQAKEHLKKVKTEKRKQKNKKIRESHLAERKANNDEGDSGEDSDAESQEDEKEEGESEYGDEDEDDDEDQKEDKDELKSKLNIENVKKEKTISNDVQQGCTVFIKNVPFDAEDADLRKVCRKFGLVNYAIINRQAVSGHSKGTAFVKFKAKESADLCLQAGTEFKLMDEVLDPHPALSREEMKSKQTQDNKKDDAKDSRNLYLAREGLIMAGAKASDGVSASDMAKRHELEQVKTQVLKNLNR